MDMEQDMNAAEWAIISAADQLACDAHRKQVRWYTEEPYFNHVERVADTIARSAEYRNDPVAIAAAYLHDTLEDTELTEEAIATACTPEVLELVKLLTHKRSMSYEAYLKRLSTDPRAWAIKRADMADNLATLPVHTSRHWLKYTKGLSTLYQCAPVELLPLTRDPE